MPTREELDTLLERLESGPDRLEEALDRLGGSAATAQPAPDEWSPSEVLAHVRAANDLLEPRIFHVLVADNPPLLAYDDERWVQVAQYMTLPAPDSLETMRRRRHELVRALRHLEPQEWDRKGNHEARGPMSVFDIASYIADHDDEHIQQISAAGR